MATNWNIDTTHSVIGFKVRHMMISNVTGTFGDFSATATTEGDDFSTANFSFRAGIDSINTGVADRDGHLKSADFFDAANHPDLTFESTAVNKINDDELEIVGDMTIRGTTKSVKLKAEFNGIAVDPYGQTKAGLSLTGKIKRSEFGLVWSAVTEAGSIVVGDEITLNTEVQFVKG
ncbi:MAG: YceI family protein [Flavobacteriales bacterium]|nr:YceI family protein [Flavobacteriales bacterium]